jgi:hypothetical protein
MRLTAEIDLLRSVFALAHERRPPLSCRIAEAIKDVFPRRKRLIETLDLVERRDSLIRWPARLKRRIGLRPKDALDLWLG